LGNEVGVIFQGVHFGLNLTVVTSVTSVTNVTNVTNVTVVTKLSNVMNYCFITFYWLCYFLKNAIFAGNSITDINLKDNTEYLLIASIKYYSYSDKWEKAYFDEMTGGFNVYHKEHNFSVKGGGGEAEKRVGIMLSKFNGKQVEFLPEGEKKSPDLLFDKQTWDIKYINNANTKTIRWYIETVRKKGADNGIFYWDKAEKLNELHLAFESEIGKMAKAGKIDAMPNIYYMDVNGLLKLLWKK
jgi:hypothetical protein